MNKRFWWIFKIIIIAVKTILDYKVRPIEFALLAYTVIVSEIYNCITSLYVQFFSGYQCAHFWLHFRCGQERNGPKCIFDRHRRNVFFSIKIYLTHEMWGALYWNNYGACLKSKSVKRKMFNVALHSGRLQWTASWQLFPWMTFKAPIRIRHGSRGNCIFTSLSPMLVMRKWQLRPVWNRR